MTTICYLNIIPKEIKDYIISLTENKVYDLCLVDRYFNNNCKVIRLVNNFKYPKFTNLNLRTLKNLAFLNLSYNRMITDEGIKGLINLTSLNLYDNEKITDDGIKGLINLTSLILHGNTKIAADGIKKFVDLLMK